jgi:hypothetical protein
MNIPLFSINAGENLELNFDLYAMIDPGQWKNQYDNTATYVVNDVIVQGNVAAQQRGMFVAALRSDQATQNIAYKNILTTSGNPPPNVTYWTPIDALLSANITGIFLELQSSGSTRVSWQYQFVGTVITQPPVLTSGLLVVGTEYKILSYVSSDDFTNVGAASNATDVVFTATGTTPTTWTNSSQLQAAVLVPGLKYMIPTYVASDDFTNIGAASNAAGIIFTSTGNRPALWTNGSTIQQVSFPSNMVLSDGLLNCELLASDSVSRSAGLYGLKLTISTLDAAFVGSGAETDVTSFYNMINIVVL